MRSAVVVEVQVTRDEVPGILIRRQPLLTVDALHLYYTVDTLCDGIVRRLVVLRHGYADIVGLKQGYICIAAVLYSTVGMVNKPLEGFASRHSHSLSDGHLQGLNADGRTERLSQGPADNLVRVGIGDKIPSSLAPLPSQCQSSTGRRPDDSGQTAGQRARPSGRTRRPAPLLLGPRFFSNRNVEILLGLVDHHVTRQSLQTGELKRLL